MSAFRGARERARAEITAAIKEVARRGLADEGAAKLSLRAVARELDMASSAVYRYFPSRDDLLTALIVDAYEAVGEAAEKALAGPGAESAPALRWSAVCRAVRGWALAHPHEYALIYGTPVPGYAAPLDTVTPASRVVRALLDTVGAAHAAGVLRTPGGPLPDAVRRDIAEVAERIGSELPVEVLTACVAAWAQLFGLIGFELFGQFDRVIDARVAFFDRAVAELARGVGLPPADAAGAAPGSGGP